MGFFGRKKKTDETAPDAGAVQQDARQVLDITRQNMMKIRDALESISMEDVRKHVSDEVISDEELSGIERDLRLMKAAIGKQTASQLVLAESEDIDAELLYFAEHLQEQLVSGSGESARTYISAIKYGITKGHEPIKESDMRHKDSIIKTRLEVIKHYKLIADLHSKTMINQRSYERLEEKLSDLTSEYQESKREAKERASQRPDLFEQMRTMTDKKSVNMTPELREFQEVFGRVTALKSQINDVKSNMSILNSNIQGQIRSIRTAETNMLTLSSVTTEEEREEIERIMGQHAQKMKEMQNEIFEYEKLYQTLDATIAAINQDQRLAKKMVNDTVGYMAILEQDQQEENAIRAGMENYRKELEAEIEGGEGSLQEEELETENEPQEHKQLLSN